MTGVTGVGWTNGRSMTGGTVGGTVGGISVTVTLGGNAGGDAGGGGVTPPRTISTSGVVGTLTGTGGT